MPVDHRVDRRLEKVEDLYFTGDTYIGPLGKHMSGLATPIRRFITTGSLMESTSVQRFSVRHLTDIGSVATACQQRCSPLLAWNHKA